MQPQGGAALQGQEESGGDGADGHQQYRAFEGQVEDEAGDGDDQHVAPDPVAAVDPVAVEQAEFDQVVGHEAAAGGDAGQRGGEEDEEGAAAEQPQGPAAEHVGEHGGQGADSVKPGGRRAAAVQHPGAQHVKGQRR